MSDKPKSLLCRLGLHSWRRFQVFLDHCDHRVCRRCGKHQTYGWGSRYWTDEGTWVNRDR